MPVPKCQRCNEDIMAYGESGRWVHRYNYSEKCPDGKGRILRPDFAPAPAPTKSAREAKMEQFAKELEEIEKRRMERAEAKAKAEAEKNAGGDDEDEDEQPKPEEPKQPEEQIDPERDEWMLVAASDINEMWKTRVRSKGFAPTDEEAAAFIKQHSRDTHVRDAKEGEQDLINALSAAFTFLQNCEQNAVPNQSIMVQFRRQLRKVILCTRCGKEYDAFVEHCEMGGEHQYGIKMPKMPEMPEPKPNDPMPPATPELKLNELAAEAKVLAKAGSKIQAIMLVCEKTMWGLKEAKQFVDGAMGEKLTCAGCRNEIYLGSSGIWFHTKKFTSSCQAAAGDEKLPADSMARPY